MERVNEPISVKEIERMQTSMAQDRPLGGAAWIERTVRRLGLAHTMRSEGRPRKADRGGK